MDLISFSLLTNIPKRSRKCHEQFRLGIGERTESSDESSAENEAPKLKPLKKKLKLSVPKDKENRWQFVDNAMEPAFGKQFVPLQAPNGPCQTLLLGEMGKTLEIKSMTHF